MRPDLPVNIAKKCARLGILGKIVPRNVTAKMEQHVPRKRDNAFVHPDGKVNNVIDHATINHMVHNVVTNVNAKMEHLATRRMVTVRVVPVLLENFAKINASKVFMDKIASKFVIVRNRTA